jgi:putative transferase (TIGR04331 family)
LPKEHLNIRLHPTFRQLSWHEEFRWKDFDQSLKLDTSDTNIFHLISRSRLVIHSYDSTGILETLSQNIPTLAFWQNDLEHLRDSAKPFYQLLVDAEIIHFTPESIAHKINEIWDDIDGWWMQKNVQDLRRQFCNRYAKESQNPIHELKTILLE